MRNDVPFWGAMICSQVWAANDVWIMALTWFFFAIVIYVIEHKLARSP
jgi:hypothetical protein